MPIPGQGAAQPHALMASRQKVSSAGVASRDRCYHGLPRKLPAGGLKPQHARGYLASRIARICPWICSQFPPAGVRWPPPPHAGRTRRLVTARAIPLMAEANLAKGAPSQPTRQDVTARLVGWRAANGVAARSRTMAMAAESSPRGLLETSCDSPRTRRALLFHDSAPTEKLRQI